MSKTDGAKTTYYINQYYDIENGQIKKHIFAGGDKVATIENNNTYYHHTDHLTGSNIDTDSTGNVLESIDYFPFGGVRVDSKTGDYSNDYKYTGKELDTDTGLYYYGARYYNSDIGRFVSEDQIVVNIAFINTQDDIKKQKSVLQNYFSNPQHLNHFSYVLNNPLHYTDPTGNIEVHEDGATKEQKESFYTALKQLQSDVANNQDIQDYFALFDVDINKVLVNDGNGPDVYITEGNTLSNDYGYYNYWTNNISLYDPNYYSFNPTKEIGSTLIHELGHWANDTSSFGWGDLTPFTATTKNPNISGFSEVENQIATHSMLDGNFEKNYKKDGAYGYAGPIILYNYIPH